MIELGTRVRLKKGVIHNCPEGREDNDTAQVRRHLDGGGLMLSRDLHGCLYWNEADVEPTPGEVELVFVDREKGPKFFALLCEIMEKDELAVDNITLIVKKARGT